MLGVMAPVAPLGRDRAIELLEKGNLPIVFGSPHPHIAIVEENGRFRIRKLVIDPAEADRARTESMAMRGMWMPEQYYALGKPTGEIFVEAATARDLVIAMKAMTWPKDW